MDVVLLFLYTKFAVHILPTSVTHDVAIRHITINSYLVSGCSLVSTLTSSDRGLCMEEASIWGEII